MIKYNVCENEIDVDLFEAQVGHGFHTHGVLSISWGLVADIDAQSESSGRWMGNARTLLLPIYHMLRNAHYEGALEFRLAPNGPEPKLPSSFTRTWKKAGYGTASYSRRTAEEEEWIVVQGSFAMVTIMNLPWLANDIQLAPETPLAEGVLTLLFMTKATRMSLLGMFMAAESGQHMNHPDLNVVQVTDVRVLPGSNNVGNVVYDGEQAPSGPFHARVIPRAATFLKGTSK